MKTPWGELRVNDAHVHFFSERFFSLIAAPKGISAAEVVSTLGWESPPSNAAEFASRWVNELDRHDVSQAVLIASIPGDEDSVVEAVGAFPDRFIGYCILDPTAPDASQRVDRAITGGLKGICLFPAMHRYPIYDERVLGVLEQIRDSSCVVFVHCGVLTVGIRKKLGLPSRFDMRFSNPMDLHGVATQYPDIPFLVPHFGAGYLREALMLCDLCPNVHLDTSSSNSWMRYCSSDMTLKDVFRRALAVAGPQRLLFGTDSSFFPRGWNKSIFNDQVAVLSSLGINADAAAMIFGENFQRLLTPTVASA